jgi:hypothetical protein
MKRWLGLLIGCLASQSCACDTSVYEYALTQWPADEYEFIVFHRGGAGAKAALAELRAATDGAANLAVRESDQNQGRLYEELLVDHPAASMPWLIVRYPARPEPAGSVGQVVVTTRRVAWAGPLEKNTAAEWLRSPARQEIARLLLTGRMAVWLLLESGDRARDEAEHTLLTRELARLERTLKLPEISGVTSTNKISFAVMRVSRTDSRERALNVMLTGLGPDLATRTGEPMVYPIYGRGRVLPVLVGSDINETTIAKDAEFITGSCSCEVKSENPGMELLISADWDGVLTGSAGIADFAERGAAAEKQLDATTTGTLADAADKEASPRGRSNDVWMSVLAGILFVATAVWVGLSVARRKRGNGR